MTSPSFLSDEKQYIKKLSFFSFLCYLSNSLSFVGRASFLEWETIQGLCYKEQTEECADFIRMMYLTRLKKVRSDGLPSLTALRRRPDPTQIRTRR